MALAGLAWQTLPDAEALALVDTVSRRAAALARPHPSDLSMADIVDVERMALAWTDGGDRHAAGRSLTDRLRSDPVRTLRALCWLLAMWAVAIHLRTGEQPTAVLQNLALRGVWRGTEAPLSNQVWDSLDRRVRLGALAALTADPAFAETFRWHVTNPHQMAEALLRHTLLVMEGLSRRMRSLDLEPRDMAGTLALYTIDPAGPPAACFRPLT
jgi:hypothetical protein